MTPSSSSSTCSTTRYHTRTGLRRRIWANTRIHTQDWAATIGRIDGFVFVTPEYNHSTSGVLKNAIDYLYAEWNNKAMGVVSYGAIGGTRAAEHLRLVDGEMQMADVRTNVALSLITDFKDFTTLAPVARTRPKSSTPCSVRSSPGARRAPYAKSPSRLADRGAAE